MKQVIRDPQDKWLGGVCGGIGKALNVDPIIVRLVYFFLTWFSAILPGIIAYVVCWKVIPSK